MDLIKKWQIVDFGISDISGLITALAENRITEQMIGVVDGQNRIFTTSSQFIAETISIFVNGIKEHGFIANSSTQITLNDAPKNDGFTDLIEAIYTKKII